MLQGEIALTLEEVQALVNEYAGTSTLYITRADPPQVKGDRDHQGAYNRHMEGQGGQLKRDRLARHPLFQKGRACGAREAVMEEGR